MCRLLKYIDLHHLLLLHSPHLRQAFQRVRHLRKLATVVLKVSFLRGLTTRRKVLRLPVLLLHPQDSHHLLASHHPWAVLEHPLLFLQAFNRDMEEGGSHF